MESLDECFLEMMELENHPSKEELYCVNKNEFDGILTSLPEDQRPERLLLQSVWGKSFGRPSKKLRSVKKHMVYEELPQTKQCRYCWLVQQYCCCNLTRKSDISLPFLLISLMNYNEYRKGSNTVKIISKTLPQECCKTLLYPYSGHMKKLEEYIRNANQTFVLFPSEDALDATSFVDIVRRQQAHVKENGLSAPTGSVVVIVIDGTWREARRMRHHPIIDGLPEIQISMDTITNYTSRFIARQKSTIVERICTLEAVALLLREMHQGFNVEESPESINSTLLLENLDVVMNQLLKQIGIKEKSNAKRAARMQQDKIYFGEDTAS